MVPVIYGARSYLQGMPGLEYRFGIPAAQKIRVGHLSHLLAAVFDLATARLCISRREANNVSIVEYCFHPPHLS